MRARITVRDPGSALRRGTKTVRGKFVEDMNGGLVKSQFVAAEVAKDGRHYVHAGSAALTALRLTLSQAALRVGTRRQRSLAFCDVAVFVHATTHGVVAVLTPDGLLERDECNLMLMALHGTPKASKRWQQHDTRVLKNSDGVGVR